MPFIKTSSALSKFVASLRDSGARKKQQTANEVLEKVVSLRAYLDEPMPPGSERARELHHLLDATREEELAKITPTFPTPVQCKRGCSACCHINVTITDDEAVLLAELVEAGLTIDLEKLKRQSSYSEDDYLKLPRPEAACVFLGEDHCCRIYEDRPASCRNYLVISKPELCEPGPGGAMRLVQIVNALNTEILASAAMNLDQDPEDAISSLPKKLLGALTRLQEKRNDCK